MKEGHRAIMDTINKIVENRIVVEPAYKKKRGSSFSDVKETISIYLGMVLKIR